jgi:ribonuclease BN (tRNA processing enzyme)
LLEVSLMRALVLGVGDAFTRRNFGSSALIEAPDGYVLLDCPDLVHRALHDATSSVGWDADASAIDDIILTHLHGDHCNGLESFGFFRRILRQRDASRPLPRIHTNGPAAGRLWERLAPAMDAAGRETPPRTMQDYFDVHVLEPDRTAAVAGLSVACRFTRHPVATIGLLVSDGKATLGWSSDTPFDEEHIEWLSGADLIVHECNQGPLHTPIAALNALPDELRAKIRLIHLPDDFDQSSTDMKPLREGEVVEVEERD